MISIIVGTHNRARSLRRTLTCLKQLQPADQFEVVVVDNRSSDSTRAVVREFLGGAPTVRYFFERKLGFSNAINRGVREARGEIVSFIDDDETVPDDWVTAVLDAFADPATDVIFTRCIVINEKGKMITDPTYRFPPRDYGPEPIVMTPENCHQYMFGTGISSYRRSVLRELGEFRTDLGRKGNQNTAGEDNDMYARCIRTGKRVVYWPKTTIYHHIDAHRIRLGKVLRRSFDFGVNHAALEPLARERHLFGVPLFTARQMLAALARLVAQVPRGPTVTRQNLDAAVYLIGTAYGLGRRWLNRSPHVPQAPSHGGEHVG